MYDKNDPQRCAEIRGTAAITEDAGSRFAVAREERHEGPGAGQEHLDLPSESYRLPRDT